jgi:hypothetical protein
MLIRTPMTSDHTKGTHSIIDSETTYIDPKKKMNMTLSDTGFEYHHFIISVRLVSGHLSWFHAGVRAFYDSNYHIECFSLPTGIVFATFLSLLTIDHTSILRT